MRVHVIPMPGTTVVKFTRGQGEFFALLLSTHHPSRCRRRRRRRRRHRPFIFTAHTCYSSLRLRRRHSKGDTVA